MENLTLNANSAFTDYDNARMILVVSKDCLAKLMMSSFYKIRLKSKVEKADEDKGIFYFRENLVYLDFQKIDSQLRNKLPSMGISYKSSQRLNDFIIKRDMHIKKRASLGIELKTDASNLTQRYLDYKKVVDEGMTRNLREKQMQDSFFMYAMKKSGNFSVPGSGKTSSALGVYCYLKTKNIVDRIVMIGPKN